MPYDIIMKTTQGDIRTQIEELTELKELMVKYWDVYVDIKMARVPSEEEREAMVHGEEEQTRGSKTR